MTPYGPLKSPDLATLCDLEPVTIRVSIDFDDDLLDRNARCLAVANRLHRNETGGRPACDHAQQHYNANWNAPILTFILLQFVRSRQWIPSFL